MIARLLCALPRWMGGDHRRGRRISPTHVRCPRCEATWTRKAKQGTQDG